MKSVISPSLPKLSLSATPLAFPDLEAEAEVKKIGARDKGNDDDDASIFS